MGIGSPQALKCARNYYVCFLALWSPSLPCTRPETVIQTAKTEAWLPNVVCAVFQDGALILKPLL